MQKTAAVFQPPWRGTDKPSGRENDFPAASGLLGEVGPAGAAEERQDPRIIVLHAVVPGRARFACERLKNDRSAQHIVERGLRRLPGIRSAEVGALTGNVIVHFDPVMRVADVEAHLDAVLSGENETSSGQAEDRAWFRLETDDLAREIGTSPVAGLSALAAQQRLAAVGRNVLPRPASRSNVEILRGQLLNLPVGLLAFAAIVSVATGAAFEALAIAGVVALNGTIGYLTESRAERVIKGLGAVDLPDAVVVRDGVQTKVPVERLVPGDLLVLARGMMVPADARLISASGLTASEAVLTGESMPVAKQVASILRADVPLGDRVNMVHRGTLLTGGSGLAFVVETGLHTQVGRIQSLVGTALPPQTPLQRRLERLGHQIVWLSLIVSGAMFGVGWVRGLGFVQLVRSSLSLAVAAVPEGLPTVATTTFALGIADMRRRGVLIRRLDAIETLAAVKVVCFDKTGTLTRNSMQVTTIACGERALRIADEAPALQADALITRLLGTGVLCSEVQVTEQHDGMVLIGSSTEKAIIQAALDHGLDVRGLRARSARLSIQHRTEAYRFMATSHDAGSGRVVVAVKGNPLEVLGRCAWEAAPEGGRRPLTGARRAAIGRINGEMADQALRVLGFADREIAGGSDVPVDDLAEDLTWIGLVGMSDPIRDGTKNLMAQLHRAGIRTVMITGDQSATARAIAQQLDLGNGTSPEIVEAENLSKLGPGESRALARRAHAFARVSPEQKLEIVRALQSTGDVVAMIGDGINDSPALRAADVGIALGQDGTSAAQDVADVVLETDDLSALLVAIERGRTTSTNIRKSVQFLLSTNGSEIIVMVAATAVGVAEALSPMQLLWINLISDVLPGLGLALEPPEDDVMRQGPRDAREAVVNRANVGPLMSQAALLGAGALGACAYGALRYGANASRTRTMTFGSLVTAQLLHAYSCRSSQTSLLGRRRMPPNPALNRALALSAAAQVAALAIPGLRALLGVAPLGLLDTGVMMAGGTLPFLIAEMRKGRGDAPQAAPDDAGSDEDANGLATNLIGATP